MKKNILLLLLLVSTCGFSQSVTDFKYAIVPAKFPFFKENDKYSLNTLTKLFMEKNGYTVFYDTDILPAETASQNCNKIFVEVASTGNIFNTKLVVIMKDCSNKVLFTSKTGESREKDYKTAYTIALREAFKSFYGLNSDPKETNQPATASVLEPKTNSVAPLVSGIHPNVAVVNAQPIENGFQLVDTTPKVVLKIFKTSQPDVYLASNETAKGMLVKKNGLWFFEYYDNDKLVSQPMNIKF